MLLHYNVAFAVVADLIYRYILFFIIFNAFHRHTESTRKDFFIYLYFPLIQVRLKVPLNMFVEHTTRVYVYTCMREYDVNDDEFFYYINRNILSIIYVCTLCVCFSFFLYLFIYFFATATNIKSLVCCIYPDIIKSFCSVCCCCCC